MNKEISFLNFWHSWNQRRTYLFAGLLAGTGCMLVMSATFGHSLLKWIVSIWNKLAVSIPVISSLL